MRLARSHAAKQALRRRPRPPQAFFNAFNAPGQMIPWLIRAPASAYTPFETLLGDSPRLISLLSQGESFHLLSVADFNLSQLTSIIQMPQDRLRSLYLALQTRLSSRISALSFVQILKTRLSLML